MARATWWGLVGAGLLLGLLVVVAFHAAAPISCTDFFWHLKLGQIIASTGSIPHTDTFSAVWPDAAYVQPQWLWEWLAAFVYEQAGFRGIRCTQGLVLVASFAALIWSVHGATGRLSAVCLVTWLAFLLFEDRFRARPDALTLGFVALSLPIFFETSPRLHVRQVCYTLGLSLLWANMHGGASLLLLLSLGALAVGATVERLRGGSNDALGPAWGQVGIASLGLLASPTLIRGVGHWASLIGAQIQTGNEEWMPTYTVLQQAVTPCTILIAAAPTLVTLAYIGEQRHWLRRHGLTQGAIGEWLLCAGYLVLSQQAIRNSVLCIVPVVFMTRRHLGIRGAGSPGRWVEPLLFSAAGLVALVTLTDVIERSYGGFESARELFSYDLAPDVYPEEMGDFLQQASIEGGVFNDGKWGGYLVFRAFPKIHVFADSRQNFSEEMWRLYLATLSLPTRQMALDAAFQRWGVELVLLRGPTFALGRAPAHYQLLYKSGDQELYQHLAGTHAPANLRRARDFLSTRGAAVGEDLTTSAQRVGAVSFLGSPFQARKVRRLLAQIREPGAVERSDAYVQLGETYYRAGLCQQALLALDAARNLAPLGTRAVYVDAFCSYALSDLARVSQRLAELQARDLGVLSRRHRERLALLQAAAAKH